MSDVVGSFKKVVNKTATEIIDAELPTRIAKVFNTFVTSVFGVVDDALDSVQDMTKEETTTTTTKTTKAAKTTKRRNKNT